MTARTTTIVALAFLALAGCGDESIVGTEPKTATIEVENGLLFDVTLEVRLGQCSERIGPVAILGPGEAHVAVVEAGCWQVAVFGTNPQGAVTTLCGTQLDVQAGETVRLRF